MRLRHVLLLAALASIWGSSYLLIKYALEDFDPGFIVWARCVEAALALGLLVRFVDPDARGAFAGLRQRPRFMVLLGTIAIAVPFLLITVGELEVSSGLTALLIAPASLFVALFAPFLDRSEQIDRRQALGLLGGLVGVAMLVGVEAVDSLAEFLGAMAILAASACYALGGFAAKRWFAGSPPVATTFSSVCGAALVTLPVGLASLPDTAPSARAVASLLALGVVHTGLAFVIFYTLLAEIGNGRASLVSYLAPAVSLALGAALLGEEITIAAVAGLALILAGVALASRRRPAEPPEGAELIEACAGTAGEGSGLSRRGSAEPPVAARRR